MKPEGTRVKVILEQAIIERGGDIGAAEIYFEGWVDDGAGTRRAFRIPHAGAIPGVHDGQTIPLQTVIFESPGPVGPRIVVHVEAWDEDLGRDSLINPDDLLGTVEESFDAAGSYGVGLHDQLHVRTDAGAWELTYRIELLDPVDDDVPELGATD